MKEILILLLTFLLLKWAIGERADPPLCLEAPPWRIDGKNIMNEFRGKVVILATMELHCKFCQNQIQNMKAMSNILLKGGMHDTKLIVVAPKNESRGWVDYWKRSLEPQGINVSQETEYEPVWDILEARNHDFFIYDRCGRLAYLIPDPQSYLYYHYTVSSLHNTHYKSPCGKCSYDPVDPVIIPTPVSVTTWIKRPNTLPTASSLQPRFRLPASGDTRPDLYPTPSPGYNPWSGTARPRLIYETTTQHPYYRRPQVTTPYYRRLAYTTPYYYNPDYTPPHSRGPEYTTPYYRRPEYTTPYYRTPEYTTPYYRRPEYTTPYYRRPEYTTPYYRMPEYPTPYYERPTPLHSRQTQPLETTVDYDYSKWEKSEEVIEANTQETVAQVPPPTASPWKSPKTTTPMPEPRTRRPKFIDGTLCTAYTDAYCYEAQEKGREIHKCCYKGLYLTDMCDHHQCTNKSQPLCCFQKFIQARFLCCQDEALTGNTADEFSHCCYKRFVYLDNDDPCCPATVASKYWNKQTSLYELCLPNVEADYSDLVLEAKMKDEQIVKVDMGERAKLLKYQCPYLEKRNDFFYYQPPDDGNSTRNFEDFDQYMEDYLSRNAFKVKKFA